MAITAEKIRMQNKMLAELESQDRPVVLSKSNYDFMAGFLKPRRLPEYVKRHGDA